MDEVQHCAKCGACTTVCPVYRVTGREADSARGKLHLLSRLPPAAASERLAEILSQCLLCGACREACPKGLDIPARIIAARRELSRQGGRHVLFRKLARDILGRPALLDNLAGLVNLADSTLGRLLPPDSGLRIRLGLNGASQEYQPSKPHHPPAAPGKQQADPPTTVAYFSGCLARHLSPAISEATTTLLATLASASCVTPTDQTCCGLAAHAAGDREAAQRLAQRNIAAFAGDKRPILTSCASCHAHLHAYPDLFPPESPWHRRALDFRNRLREFSSFFHNTKRFTKPAPSPAETSGNARPVLYHDPCHLRFQHRITAPPRQIIDALPGIRRVELSHGPQCCGMGGLFQLAHPRLAEEIRAPLLRDFQTSGAELLVSTCTGCLIHWQRGLTESRQTAAAQHLAVLMAATLAES